VKVVLSVLLAAFVSGDASGLRGRIAFSAGELEPRRSAIFVYDFATGKSRQVTHDRRVNFDPALSPDGTRVAYRSGAGENDEVFVVRVDGTDRSNLTRNRALDYSPAWSPDGRRIAFASTRAGGQLPYIWVMNADGSNPHALTRRLTGEYPAWSPNGKQIAFVTNQPVRQDGFDVAVVDADGRNAHRITHNDIYEMGPAWSRDGKWIAYHAGNGGMHDLYVMRSDGSQKRRLTHDVGEHATWSPDGRYLLYMSLTGLALIRPDGSGRRTLDVGVAEPMFPSWSR
jgi:TolB protein